MPNNYFLSQYEKLADDYQNIFTKSYSSLKKLGKIARSEFFKQSSF
jgi:hypothetical protein